MCFSYATENKVRARLPSVAITHFLSLNACGCTPGHLFLNPERCLSYEEKPLLLFQKLKEANQNPVFTLRHIKDIESPISIALAKQAQRRESMRKTLDGGSTVSKRMAGNNGGVVEPTTGFCVAIYPYMSEGEEDFDVGVGDTFLIVGKVRSLCPMNCFPALYSHAHETYCFIYRSRKAGGLCIGTWVMARFPRVNNQAGFRQVVYLRPNNHLRYQTLPTLHQFFLNIS